MSPRQKLIRGRSKVHLPNIASAVMAVSRRASWPKVFLGLGGLMIIVGLAAFYAGRNFLSPGPGTVVAPENGEVSVYRHPLTGEPSQEPVQKPHVFGVMVENSSDAWPLSGLHEAFLVIEAPVEGSIPRFLAFFYEGQESVEKIGPVRSARPYYLDWADELQALYAHVGGSPEALDLIKTNKTTKDLNQFFEDEYFWRENIGRFAPHNVYTSTSLLSSALDEVGRGTLSYQTWTFKDDAPAEGGEGISPTINWSDGTVYDVTWRYEAATNSYKRLQGSQIMLMTSGESVSADNIVVMEAEVTVVDVVGRRQVKTVGAGEAVVYQDGKKITGTWKKSSRTGRLMFFDESGKEIVMNSGKTWIEVLPSFTQLSEK